MAKFRIVSVFAMAALRRVMLALCGYGLLCGATSTAQSGTSSALAGTVSDRSGAVLPDAAVTAVETETHATRSGVTNAQGRFLFSQINPGTYVVSVHANGFADAQSAPTVVPVGRTIALDFALQLASNAQSVQVQAEQGLLSMENPNTTTTLDAKTIKNLPNPGQDLTFIAQFAQGALMNTAGSSNDAKGRRRLRQRRVQRPPRDLERLHSRRLRHQRSLARPQHRPLHEPRHRPRRHPGGHGQHQLLRRRSGPLRRRAGQLLHQVRHRPLPRRRLRDLERLAAQCRELLPARQRHPRQHRQEAALHRQRVRRQRRRPHPRRTSSSSSPTTRASASRCRWSRRPSFPRPPISNTCSSSFPTAASTPSPAPRCPRSPTRSPSTSRCSSSIATPRAPRSR